MIQIGPAMRRAARSKDSQQTSNRTSVLPFLLALILIFAVEVAHAGGPRWVAGSSYFNPSVKGQQVVWANGQVTYYTDLGNLSSQVTQAQANTMVAAAGGEGRNGAAGWGHALGGLLVGMSFSPLLC